MRLSDKQISRLSVSLSEPEILNERYELNGVLGSGGMGVVFAAHDAVLERDVAIKIIDIVKDPKHSIERLLKEARILARLDHPGIIPVHDAGELPDGRLFYVMKLVQGSTLEQLIGRETSLALRLRIFQNICDAVAFAHSVGIIHRDLTPRNVMVGSFGETFVLDWGLAGGFERSPPSNTTDQTVQRDRLTLDGVIMGTPGFMAPEQALGQRDLISESTDIYGLGAILYFLLAGQPPFIDAAPVALRKLIIEEAPKPLAGNIPKPLQAICLRCLQKNAVDRYQSVQELRSDVVRFLDAESVAVYRENVFEFLKRWGLRNKPILFLIFAYLLMRLAVALLAR